MLQKGKKFQELGFCSQSQSHSCYDFQGWDTVSIKLSPNILKALKKKFDVCPPLLQWRIIKYNSFDFFWSLKNSFWVVNFLDFPKCKLPEHEICEDILRQLGGCEWQPIVAQSHGEPLEAHVDHPPSECLWGAEHSQQGHCGGIRLMFVNINFYWFWIFK